MFTPLSKPPRELREDILALARECPFDDGNPVDCPLHQLRKLKPSQRLRWVNSLTDVDLKYLSAYHHGCFKTKLGA